MRRLAVLCSLLALLIVPGSASAAAPSMTGTITYVSMSTLTIGTGGRLLAVIPALERGADSVAAQHWPYVWGGGHSLAGAPSIGVKGGPGYNGKRIGYDCSGSVAAVLVAAGLWPAGSPVPTEAGMIRTLSAEGLIARGVGTGASQVTLYDDPGVHIFIDIDGHYFGTSDGGGGDPSGTPTWLDDGAPDASSPKFHPWHFVPAALRSRLAYAHAFSFSTSSQPTLTAGASAGDKVNVSYRSRAGSMVAQAVTYPGARTARGTVTAIAPSLATVNVNLRDGEVFQLTTSAVPNLIAGLAVGDGITFTYSKEPTGALIPRTLQITSTPAPYAPTTPTTTQTPTTTTPGLLPLP